MNKVESRERLIVIIAACTLLVAFVALWAWRRFKPEEAPDTRPIPVLTVRPARLDMQNTLVAPAILESERTIAVLPRVSGTLVEILALEGQIVNEGDILARVDPEPYILELRAAESAWRLAEGTLERTKRIHENSGASQQRLEEAIASHDSALAAYELAQMRRKDADVQAPISGVILIRHADVGSMTSPEYPLFTIGDPSMPRVKVRVSEKYWDAFHNPEAIGVTVKRPGETGRPAAILRVSPSISPENKTFGVTCLPENGELWPLGSRLSVEFLLDERRNSWALPQRAASGDGGVWRVNEESNVVSRLDLPDIFSSQVHFAIPDQWADDLFVLDGHHRLQESLLVAPFRGDH